VLSRSLTDIRAEREREQQAHTLAAAQAAWRHGSGGGGATNATSSTENDAALAQLLQETLQEEMVSEAAAARKAAEEAQPLDVLEDQRLQIHDWLAANAAGLTVLDVEENPFARVGMPL
jgi:hypothetical protein